MHRTFFVTGTNTGVGKTVLTALLTRFLRDRGVRVAALKPLCSGGRADARALRAALQNTLPLDEINPWHFRRPLAPALAARFEKKSVPLDLVLAHIRNLRADFEVTLVEGAGGLLSPLGNDFNSRDLIAALDATPIIVAPNQLGALNQILLTLEALPARSRALARIVWVSAPVPDSAARSNPKLLAEFFPVERTYTLPWLGEKWLASNALKQKPVKQALNDIIPFRRSTRT